MNSIDFCYWLQGYFEVSGNSEITQLQAEIIKNHLALAFKHEIDPLRERQTKATAAELNNLHDPKNDTLMRC